MGPSFRTNVHFLKCWNRCSTAIKSIFQRIFAHRAALYQKTSLKSHLLDGCSRCSQGSVPSYCLHSSIRNVSSVLLSFMHNCSIPRNTLTLKCRALEFIAATQILPRPHWLWLLLRMKTRIPFPLMSVTFRNEAQCKNTRVPCFAYSFNSTPRYWN